MASNDSDDNDPDDSVQSELNLNPDEEEVVKKIISEHTEEIEPFRRKREDYLFKYEGLLNIAITTLLLIGAHLNLVSIWWLFGFFAITIIPPEFNKVRKYGLSRYLGAMNFKMLSLKQFGVIILGLLSIFALLILATHLAINFLSQSAMSGGGHLIGDAYINIYIWFGAILMMYLVVGPLEEYFFRHKLQKFLNKELNLVTAIIITNISFSLLHIPVLAITGSAISYIIPLSILTMLGTIFSIQYEYTDNLAVPALTHSTYNSILISILFATKAGFF